MRIIGGKYKGKSFNPPANIKTRPTTSFAKEGLFNVLIHNFNLENTDVLDLFSGTGSISLEFCSRNCKSLVAVELIKKNALFIEKKFHELNFNQAKVYNSDVFSFLKKCSKKFDIIFADPPFEMPEPGEIYDAVFENNLLSDTSFLIIEHDSNNNFSDYKHFLMEKKYGKVHFSFFDPIV